MTVDRDEASALLGDVEGIENRIRQLLLYARISDYLFLWGAISLVKMCGLNARRSLPKSEMRTLILSRHRPVWMPRVKR